MTISQTSSVCNRENKLTDSFIGKGNLIPHIWYHKILRSNGKPDTVGISILSELSYLYRSSKANKREFQLSYSHFINKFNFTRDQIYEAFTRLENAGLVTRDERTVVIDGRRHGNELFLTINIENLVKLCGSAEDKEISVNENSSVSYEEISSYPIGKYPETLQGNILEPFEEISQPPMRKFPNTPQGNIPIPYEEISSMYIDKKDLKKDNRSRSRSNESNFIENEELKDLEQEVCVQESVAKNFGSDLAIPVKSTTINHQRARKSLSEFYPISEEDARVLCQSSDREFTLDDVNSLILKLSKKKPNHGFFTKELFMNYMKQALVNELEQVEEQTTTAYSPAISFRVEAPVIDQTTPWGKIRAALCDHYGKMGNALDKAWFGQLVPVEGADSSNLVLKAPTNFICDYIEQHYLHTIKRLCSAQKYSFSITV